MQLVDGELYWLESRIYRARRDKFNNWWLVDMDFETPEIKVVGTCLYEGWDDGDGLTFDLTIPAFFTSDLTDAPVLDIDVWGEAL